ncbi:hypothetical protein [Pedobacter westerhofensis]|nr:hypothetical protein [Pedobacter westerhofensis]
MTVQGITVVENLLILETKTGLSTKLGAYFKSPDHKDMINNYKLRKN